jgi:carbonic anhydrase
VKDCHSLTTQDFAADGFSVGGFSVGRRKFVQLAALGGGLSMFLGASPARAAGGTDALLLSCMDFRLIDDLVKYMDSRGMTDKYDHVILAGASAGAAHEKFAAWHETFWSHLQVAIDLHKIHKVMIIDHRDCGAYKIAIGPDHTKDAELERAAHAAILLPLTAAIKEKYPALEVETYLMALDGSVEEIKA